MEHRIGCLSQSLGRNKGLFFSSFQKAIVIVSNATQCHALKGFVRWIKAVNDYKKGQNLFFLSVTIYECKININASDIPTPYLCHVRVLLATLQMYLYSDNISAGIDMVYLTSYLHKETHKKRIYIMRFGGLYSLQL